MGYEKADIWASHKLQQIVDYSLLTFFTTDI